MKYERGEKRSTFIFDIRLRLWKAIQDKKRRQTAN